MAKRAEKPRPSTARTRRSKARQYLIELSTFEGEDTACYLLGVDPMWIVISASPTAGASIVDFGYRSLKEAQEAWPEAVAPGPEMCGADPRVRSGWNRIPPVFSEPWFQAAWKKAKRSRARSASGARGP